MHKKDYREIERKVTGKLYGHFETGFEGTAWALMDVDHIYTDKGGEERYSYSGLNFIRPGSYLTVYEKNTKPEDNKVLWEGELVGLVSSQFKEKNEYTDPETGLVVGWKNYPKNPSMGQLHINNYWVHWIPMNVDLNLWFDIFFASSDQYYGKLIYTQRIFEEKRE